jgi:hypothetical protein
MEQERVARSLEGIGRLYPDSYDSFERKVEEALYVFEIGAEEAPRFATADEILEASDQDCKNFNRIVNLLTRSGILPAWNNDTPYRINTEEYSFEDLEKAYEVVTGEEYETPETRNEVASDVITNPLDEALEAELEYESTD